AYRRFTMNNVVDKYVTVENTGKSDAYVRTIIALEMGDYSYDEFNMVGLSNNAENGSQFKFPGAWEWTDDFVAEIDGKNYNVMVAVHKDPVEPGETTIPSLLQVYLSKDAGNTEVEKLDGNGNGTYDILVLSQAVQTAGFDSAAAALDTAFGDVTAANAAAWFSGNEFKPVTVGTTAELQNALNTAEDGATIILTDDIAESVTFTAKEDVAVTIDGAGKEFDGVITVDGKSGTFLTSGLTIKNVNFTADSLPADADACIRLGKQGDNNTRYTCNVTVENCTFDVSGAVGVKSYTGGDKNLTIIGCTATDKAHSLVQAKGIDGVLVKDCEVYSKNGLNFNNSDNVVVDGCTVDVKGYAVRFGESSGGVGAAETYLIKNSTLKSANDGGDAVIILRGTADHSTLTIENTTITGTPDITITAAGATVIK
ncbi:MAG: right-handed parallel beta-helix repeat-containing protein, partial [Oscillospiraceae bacterium]|nr:right-handed parallel beta-helix repeat-containing protein [Oscillospiraceae bacterium]